MQRQPEELPCPLEAWPVVALKKHNTMSIPTSLAGLPKGWRTRIEGIVRDASPAFDLYVTSVKAGAQSNPEGILISIARDGAEEAWSRQVERTISDRIRAEVDALRAQVREEQAAQLRLEAGWDAERGSQVSTKEDLSSMLSEERLQLITARHALTRELRLTLQGADLDTGTATFCGLAFQQMEYPERWALWARLLLVVHETEAALPLELQQKLMKLA